MWLLIVGLAVVAAVNLAARLRLVVVPVAIALLFATFLAPPVRWLKDHGWRDGLAAVTVLGAALLAFGGLGVLLVPPVVDQFADLDIGISGGIDRVQQWLADSPLPLSSDEVADAIDRAQAQLSDSFGTLANEVVSGAAIALEVVAGLLLTIVVLFFLLKDGARMWEWTAGLAPAHRRADVAEMGERAWTALGAFVRGQTLVALFDSVLIGLALVIIGVPLVLPLAVLTFFGAYVPVVGATLTAMLAVLVALVSNGLAAAVAVLAAILVVQQIEGNVFHPVVVGRAVHAHPVVILLAVPAGGVLAGIIGALLAAPIVAVGTAVLGYLRERADDSQRVHVQRPRASARAP
ncbi:MAG TPA: AI-2E family transporter [Solirubrobacteraceae bacterium]|nr:AI-2E family transporter [Solirubrobacteraceae bacterium]